MQRKTTPERVKLTPREYPENIQNLL